jgi:histidine triad (HIT) family protein
LSAALWPLKGLHGMMSVEACVFCRIVRGEAPATVLKQDGRLVVFRDLHPVAPIHILIAPVKHLASLNDADASDVSLLGEMLLLARHMAAQEAVDRTGYRLVINTGVEAGQSVHHLHMHLLARRRMGWPPG